MHLEQADQLPPDERSRFDVIGRATQRANCATEISRECAQAAAREIREKAPGDIARAHHVERKHVGRQRAKERLLESSEVDDRRRRLLRKTRGLVGQLSPCEVPVDSGRHHALGDPRDPRNDWRNPLAIRKRDQRRMRVRNCLAHAGPANLKEMPSWSRSGGLAVDHQHLELRKRLGTTVRHHLPRPESGARGRRSLQSESLVRRVVVSIVASSVSRRG